MRLTPHRRCLMRAATLAPSVLVAASGTGARRMVRAVRLRRWTTTPSITPSRPTWDTSLGSAVTAATCPGPPAGTERQRRLLGR